MPFVATYHNLFRDMLLNGPFSGLLTDLYELTMAAGYVQNRFDARATFELFVRNLPQRRNYLVAAGLEQALDFLENVRFSRRTFPTCAVCLSSATFIQIFLIICRDFNSRATFGRYLKERFSFRVSRYSV